MVFGRLLVNIGREGDGEEESSRWRRGIVGKNINIRFNFVGGGFIRKKEKIVFFRL